MARVLETDTYLQPVSLQSQLISGQSEFVRPWTISSCPKDNPRYYAQDDPSESFSRNSPNRVHDDGPSISNTTCNSRGCGRNETSTTSISSCLPSRRSAGQCQSSDHQRPVSGDQTRPPNGEQQPRTSALPPSGSHSPCDAACEAECHPATPSFGSVCGNFAASPSDRRDAAARVSPLKATTAISSAVAAQSTTARASSASVAADPPTPPRCGNAERRKKKDHPVSTSPRSRSIEEIASPSSPINRNFSFLERSAPQPQHDLQRSILAQLQLQRHPHLPASQAQLHPHQKPHPPQKLDFPRLNPLSEGHPTGAFAPNSVDASLPFPPALNISKLSSAAAAAAAATQSCARERLVARPTLPPRCQREDAARFVTPDSSESEGMSESTSDARSIASNQTEEERLHVAKTWVFDPDALFKNTHMIRVSQLNKTTSMETFHAYFSKFGKISDCKLLLRDFVKVYDSEDPRRSIDFKVVGEIYYDQNWSSQAFHAIFGVKNHVLDSHALQISLLFPPMFTTSLALQDNRVFIGGIAVSAKYQVANLTHYLNALFSQYGDIFHVRASFFSSSQSPTTSSAASAVVTFRDASSANAAVRTAKTAWNVKLLAAMVAEVDEPYPMWV